MNKKEILAELQQFLNPERIERFEDVLANRTKHFTVAVENIFQSHNASAVMRSCDCFGVQDLHVIANHNQYELSKDVAMGAEKWVDMHSYYKKENNTQDCIDELKSQGFQIVATTPHTNDVLLPDFEVTKKSAFFFGTEISGLSDIVLDQADAFVRIPMYGFTESYNISVSAALVLHDVVNRLKKSEVDWALSEEELMDKRIDWAVKSLKSGPQVLAQLLSKADS
ncbi:MAG: RNA methyltransferase [Flavobacteriales bacterium]|jgi:tRNA (guanosine-2'-O-)-methyltransferase|tara:strand:+ start:71 stop:745 length:675 start_codon:yes stop_codon:yes gene_type:complete